MMPQAIFAICLFGLMTGIFLVTKKWKYYLTLVLVLAGVFLTSCWSFDLFSSLDQIQEIKIYPFGADSGLIFTIDRLSAFFIFVINLTVVTGILYAYGYLKPYLNSKSDIQLSIHYFSYLFLHYSMLMVVMLRDGLAFLIAWEIMAVSSFVLVIFDAEDKATLKTGIRYLVQMHIGMFFLLIAFLIAGRETGITGFDSLPAYFSTHPNFGLFLLFFIGFGIKAGFLFLHTWLPDAHPAAPSHVSGVMSGVMIKMGIYGILRVVFQLQNDFLSIGLTILIVSILSGILGVMMAIMQHDIKRLLAYHSIENIGIIGIGTGLGVIGLAVHNPFLIITGFGGGLLHVLNHSLFKSLLFFSAGAVYQATHTRNVEQMGGLLKKMPWSALFFLIGSLAICGLPPFNGFISEYLIYIGMFKSLPASSMYQAIILISTIVALSLIGGLAIFCFTKAFGIVFLGEARTQKAAEAKEAAFSTILPQFIPVLFIISIGLLSAWFARPVFSIVQQATFLPEAADLAAPVLKNLTGINLAGGIFIGLVVLLLLYRRQHLKNRPVACQPTWGCGYTAVTPRHQYTATSYVYNYNHLAKPLLHTRKIMAEIREDEIFPDKRTFVSHSEDIIKEYLTDKPANWGLSVLKRIAAMQTGKIQHYILYAFLFMLLVLILTYLKLL